MPIITRYHPVSHDFNRDNEVVEARKRFGDWIGFAWLECLSIGDRNNGIIPGTIEQIADRLAPISLQKYHKRAADTAKNFLRYAADCSWIVVRTPTELQRNSGETDRIEIVKFAKYHKRRETKQAPSEPNLPKQPIKEEEKNKSRPPPAEALKIAQLLSDLIFRNFPDRTPPTEAQLMNWAKEAERLNRLDGHSWDQIAELLEWSQADSFWKANILSMSKFREKWNQLLAKKESENGRPSSPEPKGFAGIREILKNHA